MFYVRLNNTSRLDGFSRVLSTDSDRIAALVTPSRTKDEGFVDGECHGCEGDQGRNL
jgi:hypothetical protein